MCPRPIPDGKTGDVRKIIYCDRIRKNSVFLRILRNSAPITRKVRAAARLNAFKITLFRQLEHSGKCAILKYHASFAQYDSSLK